MSVGKLSKLFQHNWWAIFYFNLKMLPFRQAVKLPFDFYRGVSLRNLTGKVKLSSDNIHRAMIRIGGRGSEMFPRTQTIVDIEGNVVFYGSAELGCGSLLRVYNGAVVTFGDRVRIGAYTKVICQESITFGSEIDVSWESQIFDTNFHYMEDTATGKRTKLTQPVVIGSYNWFGNRVNIMRGTKTPDYTILASNSMTNKDYTDIPPYSLLAGTPAKLVKTDVRRMFEGVDL